MFCRPRITCAARAILTGVTALVYAPAYTRKITVRRRQCSDLYRHTEISGPTRAREATWVGGTGNHACVAVAARGVGVHALPSVQVFIQGRTYSYPSDRPLVKESLLSPRAVTTALNKCLREKTIISLRFEFYIL